jgi:hypothetical protein
MVWRKKIYSVQAIAKMFRQHEEKLKRIPLSIPAGFFWRIRG